MRELSKELGLPNPQDVNLPSFEASSYGAAHLVAGHLGIKEPPITLAGWMHGWNHFDFVNKEDILTIAYDVNQHQPGQPKFVIPAQKRRPYLVATKEQEVFLQENGFPDTRAVGLPFAYIDPDPSTKRIPGSLLVMPPHIPVEETVIFEYLDYIKSISQHFSRIVFCLHMASIVDGPWVSNVNAYGFEYVTGAGGRDRNALYRMRKIFDSFEYMTTKSIGSHVLYASLCGVKVSMTTPYIDVRMEDYMVQAGWGESEHMKKVELYVKMGSYNFLSKKFPQFFVEPQNAVEQVEWAKREIGFYNKVSFEELGRLFRWLPAKPENFHEAVFRMDASHDFTALIDYINSKQHDLNAVVSASNKLLAQGRLRSAFILALLIMNKGVQNPLVSVALSVGGLVYNDPEAEAHGMRTLQAQIDGLSVALQTTIYTHAVAPAVSPLLITALQNSDTDRVQRLIKILQAAVPRFRTEEEWKLTVKDGVIYKRLF